MSQVERIELSDERSVIDQALKTVPLPINVRKVEFELGHDATNEESVTIWIRIPSNIDPDRNTVARLSEFAAKLRDAVFATGLGRFPYVRYKTAR